jgi:hypothetical protein
MVMATWVSGPVSNLIIFQLPPQHKSTDNAEDQCETVGCSRSKNIEFRRRVLTRVENEMGAAWLEAGWANREREAGVHGIAVSFRGRRCTANPVRRLDTAQFFFVFSGKSGNYLLVQ